MLELSADNPRRYEILRALERSLDALDIGDVAATAAAARACLVDVLSSPARARAHTISATGHAHIDSAWLWPIRETKRKVSRTFANVTALAKEYPELVFSGPQAQQYAWLKERYPEIFDRMREADKAGQWVPRGGAVVGHRGRTGRARVPVRGAGPALENGAAAPVPRHPARQLDRLGAS